MKITYILIIITFSFFIITSCNLEQEPEETEPPVVYRTVTLTGYIKSITDYSGIPMAEITIAGVTTESDSEGWFSIAAEGVTDDESIKIRAPGYVDWQKSLSNFGREALQVEFTLKPIDVVAEIDPAREDGNRITTLSKASVHIPQIEDITENLEVSVTNIDVGTDEINCAPGDFTAIDDEDNETVIISMGMIDVSIKGKETGNTYDMAEFGASYDITIPITGDINAAPDTIPMWYFDENNCRWVEEGTLTKSTEDPGIYEGTVSHFSTWNADYKGDVIKIYGSIDDPTAEDTESYEIKLVSEGFSKCWHINDRDFLIVNVPRDRFMKIYVKKMSTLTTWTRYFYSYNTSGCVDVGVFPGPDDLTDVSGLMVVTGHDNAYLSWTSEPTGIEGIFITYHPFYSTLTNYVFVETGINEAEITGLTPGPYAITVQTYDSEGRESGGITQKVRVNDAYIFEVTNTIEDPDFAILYKYNDDPVYKSCQHLEAIIPRGTKITLDITAVDTDDYAWCEDGQSTGLSAFPVEYTIEDDDLIINLVLYSC